MKNLFFKLYCCVGILFTSNLMAQNGSYDLFNPSMKQIASLESEQNWIKFKSSAKINPETIFEDHKVAFEISTFDKMVVNKTFVDDIGFTHRNYQQYFRGVMIDGESMNVHTNKNGETYAATGRILKGINIDVVPKLTPQEAIEAALRYVNAQEYMWQNALFENELKEKENDATYYPKPQLVIKEKRTFNAGTGVYHLAYRMDIYAASPHYYQRIFVDAHSGEIIDKYPLQSN